MMNNSVGGGAKQQTHGIIAPHEHDVLSGRGNFVNYHAGNEHFRALVRKHKLEYVKCPKPQKGKFSRMIVDEIKNRHPPGRFLKQDGATKLWYDIGEKKALDKTRQALREGAPEIMKDMTGEEGEDGDTDGLSSANNHNHNHVKVAGGNNKNTPGNHSKQPAGGNSRTGAGGARQNAFMRPGSNSNNPHSMPQDNFRRNNDGGINIADLPSGFMGAMQSPVGNQRHALQLSPQLSQHLSPRGGMLSPGMMGGMPHTPLSPDVPSSMHMSIQSRMQQLASGQLQLQQLEQQQTALHEQVAAAAQQITNPNQLAQHMNMQNQMMNHPGVAGMQNFQNDLEALRIKQRQIEMLQAKQREMEALQAQLALAYQNSDNFEPRPIADQVASSQDLAASAPAFGGRMRKPKTVPLNDRGDDGGGGGSGSGNAPVAAAASMNMQQHQQQHPHQQQSQAHAQAQSQRVLVSQSDHVPRRKPPPTLKRENSLKIEKVFVGDGSNQTKKKYDGNGSSAHMSAMSLSIGDMADETNLSAVFDSSLQISSEESEFRDTLSPMMRKKPGAVPSLTNAWDGKNPFDMSVATIGDKVSDAGNMSMNTFAEKMGESESNMSFSKVFDDSGAP